MTLEKQQELQTLLDGIDFDLNESKKFIYQAEQKRQQMVELLSPEVKDEF